MAEQALTARPWGVLHHVHLFCNDLEAMIDFWRQGFDARLVRRRPFGPCDGAEMDLGSGVLLYLKALPCCIPSDNDDSGLDHIGVKVADLAASLERLLALPGVVLKTPPFVSAALLCAFIRTEDGVIVELVQDIPNEQA